MNTKNDLLPKNPDYDTACNLIDADDPVFWQPVIQHICQQHQIDVTPFVCVNGWANGIFILENDLLIKIVPPNWGAQATSEIIGLTLVAQHDLSVAVPQLIATGDINGWVYIIMSKLPGTNLHEIWPQLPQDNRCLIAKQVGQFARRLNQLPLDPAASSADPANKGELTRDWPTFLQSQKDNCYEKRKKQGLSEPLLADLMPFLNQTDYQTKTDKVKAVNNGQPCLMHTDLHPGNLLAEKVGDSWQLSGVIDFGDAIISTDPWFDLSSSILFMGLADKTVNQAFLAGYGLTIAEHEHKAFQQHQMALCLLRHTGDINYPLQQVPGCEKLNDWQSLSEHLFAL